MGIGAIVIASEGYAVAVTFSVRAATRPAGKLRHLMTEGMRFWVFGCHWGNVTALSRVSV